MARHDRAHPGAGPTGAARRDQAAVPGASRGVRVGAVTSPAETAQATTAILESGAIMLGAALVFVTLFRQLRLGATLGYIVAGALIGPQLLGLIKDPGQVTSVTEIGIALLLFIVGLELRPRQLWRLRRDIFGLGLLQVVLCGLALSGLLYLAIGISPAAALAIGLPLGLSSTAQVLPMLRDDNELNTPQGERAFSILLFQDLAIVPMITIIAALARVPPDPSAPTGWTLAGMTLAAVIALVLVGRLILNPLFRLVGRLGERELFVVAGLFTVVGAAAVMHTLHLSVPLGAFVAGVVLAESPYRHEIESDVEPFRSILLGLFFLSVGMLLNLSLIAARPLFVLGIAAGVIVTKAVLIAGLARLFRNSWPRSVRLGLLLSQAGEFGFVLFAMATAAQVIAFCNDNEGGELTRDAVAAVLKAFPQAAVMVRAFDRVHLMQLDGLDLAFAQRELFESAVVMGKAALKASGIDKGEVERVEREYRMRDCDRLERQSATGDLHAGLARSFAPDRALPEDEVRNPA